MIFNEFQLEKQFEAYFESLILFGDNLWKKDFWRRLENRLQIG